MGGSRKRKDLRGCGLVAVWRLLRCKVQQNEPPESSAKRSEGKSGVRWKGRLGVSVRASPQRGQDKCSLVPYKYSVMWKHSMDMASSGLFFFNPPFPFPFKKNFLKVYNLK